MLAIFGFRKNRSQTFSDQVRESEAGVYGDGSHTVATAPTGFVYAQTQTQTNAQRKIKPQTDNSPHLVHIYLFLLPVRTLISTLSNITLNIPHFFLDTRNG